MDWTKTFFDTDYVELLRAQMEDDLTAFQVDFVENALKLKPPARILDVACGFGRHSLELARRGYDVVGLDSSEAMLAEARKPGSSPGTIRFVHCDMRDIPFRDEFDAVINLFTSFGYFSPRENDRVLRKMAAALKPGGMIMIDTRDRLHDQRALAKRGNRHNMWWAVGDSFIVLEDMKYNPGRGLCSNRWKIMKRDGISWSMSEKEFRLYIYYRSQLAKMAGGFGIRKKAVYSGFGSEADTLTFGRRMIFVGEKKK